MHESLNTYINNKDNDIELEFATVLPSNVEAHQKEMRGQKRTVKKNAESTACKNITLMVMWVGFLYLFGTAPHSVSFIMKFFVIETTEFLIYRIFCSALLKIVHGLNIFVYYRFNYIFRTILIAYLKKIFFIQSIFQ